MIVINSLEELYNTNFEGNFYVACSHVKEFLTKVNQVRLGVEEDVPYINTGVMVLNLTALRDNLTFEQIKQTAQKKMHTFLLPTILGIWQMSGCIVIGRIGIRTRKGRP